MTIKDSLYGRGYLEHIGDVVQAGKNSSPKGFKKHWALTGALLSIFGLAFKDKNKCWINKKSAIHYLDRNRDNLHFSIDDMLNMPDLKDQLSVKVVKKLFRKVQMASKSDSTNALNLDSVNLSEYSINEVNLLLPKIKSVRNLSLKYVDDSSLEKLENFKHLTTLNCEDSFQITSNGLAHLANLNQLTSIKFTNCHKITDAGLKYFSNLNQLTSLEFTNCQNITGAGLKYFSNLNQLTYLNLSRSKKITDEGIEKIKNLSELTHLNLSGCSITDDALDNLKELIHLTHLNLSGCSITDAGLNKLKNFNQIMYLNLDYCKNFTINGILQLKNSNLKTLSIRSCDQLGTDVVILDRKLNINVKLI